LFAFHVVWSWWMSYRACSATCYHYGW